MGVDISWQEWVDAVHEGVFSIPDQRLRRVAEVLAAAPLVITAGNGGSASLASHAAQALMKPDYRAGGGIAAVCLTDAVPTLTAHANDGGWENALVRMVQTFLPLKPALLVFTSSGTSRNIVQLAQLAREHSCEVVAFTGFGGGLFSRGLATQSVHVDSHNYEVVEPVHDALLHRVQYHLRSVKR